MKNKIIEILNANDLEFLEDLANRYIKQDNHCQAFPMMIALQVEKDVPVYHPEEHSKKILNSDGSLIWDEEIINELNIENLLDSYGYNNLFIMMDDYASVEEYTNNEILEKIETLHKSDNINEIKEVLGDYFLDNDLYVVASEKEYQYTDNFFLTQDAYDKHIKTNGHNLRNPRPYRIRPYRNWELEKLLKIVLKFRTINIDGTWLEKALKE